MYLNEANWGNNKFGDNIQVWSDWWAAESRWEMQELRHGVYSIQNYKSKGFLNVDINYPNQRRRRRRGVYNANVQVWGDSLASESQWEVVAVYDGVFDIKSQGSYLNQDIGRRRG